MVFKIPGDTLPRWLRLARLGLGWLTLAYGGGALLVMIALEWGGERLWLLSLLLFAPPQVMLLPLLVLTPLCVVFRPRLCLWHLAVVLVLAFGYMNFRWSWPPPRTEKGITAVTFNAGQSSRTQFAEFVEQGLGFRRLVRLEIEAHQQGALDHVRLFSDFKHPRHR